MTFKWWKLVFLNSLRLSLFASYTIYLIMKARETWQTCRCPFFEEYKKRATLFWQCFTPANQPQTLSSNKIAVIKQSVRVVGWDIEIHAFSVSSEKRTSTDLFCYTASRFRMSSAIFYIDTVDPVWRVCYWHVTRLRDLIVSIIRGAVREIPFHVTIPLRRNWKVEMMAKETNSMQQTFFKFATMSHFHTIQFFRMLPHSFLSINQKIQSSTPLSLSLSLSRCILQWGQMSRIHKTRNEIIWRASEYS